MDLKRRSGAATGLMTVKEVPPHLAFNSFIRRGYRAHFSFWECFASLFYMHNESLNVYTHGCMAVYLCLGLPLYLTTSSSQLNILSLVNFLACVAPFVLSTTYHLFLCHKKGAGLYNQLLCADVVGIAVVNCIGFLVPIWVTLACHSTLRNVAMFFYMLMSVVILNYFVAAKSAKQRCKPLLGFFFMRLFILAIRMLYLGNTRSGDASAWLFYVAMDLLAATGATINFARIPERFFPGKFDYIFNSHQLMHIFTMVGIWCLNEGSHRDINWLIAKQGQSCNNGQSYISRV